MSLSSRSLLNFSGIVRPAEGHGHPVPGPTLGEGLDQGVPDDLPGTLVTPVLLRGTQFHEQHRLPERGRTVVGRLECYLVLLQVIPPLVERQEVVLQQVRVDTPNLLGSARRAPACP